MIDPEPLADRLRDLADRLEDGEVEVSEIGLHRPDYEHERRGKFSFEFVHEETMRRWQAAYDDATNHP